MQQSRRLGRPDRRLFLRALAALAATPTGVLAQSEDFQGFLQKLWPAAQAAGVSRETFDAATAGLSPDPGVVLKPRAQGEFTVAISTYVAGAVTKERVTKGRALAQEFAKTLADARARTGVPGELCLAIMAVESNFGTATGGSDVLRVLATLAWKGHMTEKLSAEFVDALLMLQQGVPRGRLRGSWAGAMGMPQFMPSAYLKYATSAAGSGSADIWGSRPDALASIATFLGQSGWNAALPWGVEVRVPESFDYAAFDMDLAQFRALGFAQANGAALPASGAASLYQPAGATGPAFLITENWEVVRQYNTSDAYALAVCLLADRIAGRNIPLQPWPKITPLSTAQVQAMQQALTRGGFYNGVIDGKLGRASRNAVHAYQLSAGISPADGFASPALLEGLLGGR